MVRGANGSGKNGACGRNDDEVRWIVAQIAQNSAASFAGWCAGFCWDEDVSDAVMLAMTEPLASFSR